MQARNPVGVYGSAFGKSECPSLRTPQAQVGAWTMTRHCCALCGEPIRRTPTGDICAACEDRGRLDRDAFAKEETNR